jgi:hypothetical protein
MSLVGCVSAYRQSLGKDTENVLSKVYLTDYNTAWQSVLDATKSLRLDISNRESGFIQSRWTDNTAERNSADALGITPLYLKAQFRFKINVAKGFYQGRPSVKVSVQKEQVAQRDLLEDWRHVTTNDIEENTLLYRIGRIIYIKTKIAKLEEIRTNQAIKDASHFD